MQNSIKPDKEFLFKVEFDKIVLHYVFGTLVLSFQVYTLETVLFTILRVN